VASFRFGFGPVADRGYADQLADLVREWTLANVFDDFGRFARNPVQPRNPAITPVSGVPFPSSPPLVPVPGSPSLPPPSPTFPGRPGGISLPDRTPGSIAGSVVRSILRGGWIGALYYPSANPRGRGSQLCIETEYGPWCPPGLPNADQAVPAPVAVPGRRARRRPRAVPAAPGRRRRARPGVIAPGGTVVANPPRPRGPPGTL
jgi:hypothetical protein